MDWRETCVSRAASCEEKAKQARDPEVAQIYLELAGQWRELAKDPPSPIVETPSDDIT